MPERSAVPVANEPQPIETGVVDAPPPRRALRITWLGWGIIAVGLLVAAGYGGLLIGSGQKTITSHQSLANDGNTTVTSEEDAIAKVAGNCKSSGHSFAKCCINHNTIYLELVCRGYI